MSAKYEVLSQTVEVLLSPGTAQFQVPVFQRRYAWGVEEIGQLIDDLSASLGRPTSLTSLAP